jgi:cytidylate kinase
MAKTEEQLVTQAFIKNGLKSKTPAHLFPTPPIMISRDPGSGGHPIAKLLSNKLKYNFYDEELIKAVAKSAKRTQQIISDVDEKTRSQLQDFIQTIFNPEYISETTYIRHLVNVVVSLSHQGKSVILGRGANFILPRDKTYSVLITAPKSVRVRRAIEYEHYSHNKALKVINKYTKERREFVSQYFHKNYSNPLNYDLVVNTQYYTVEAAVNLLISGYKSKFPEVKLPSIPPLTAKRN